MLHENTAAEIDTGVWHAQEDRKYHAKDGWTCPGEDGEQPIDGKCPLCSDNHTVATGPA